MVRITFESDTPQQLTDWLINYLQGLGYNVSPQQPVPETPQQLAQRLGLSRRHILRRLAHPGCPRVRVVQSPAERVSLIYATPALDAFLTRPLRGSPSSSG